MAGCYSGSYLDRHNGWRAVAILGWHRSSFTRGNASPFRNVGPPQSSDNVQLVWYRAIVS